MEHRHLHFQGTLDAPVRRRLPAVRPSRVTPEWAWPDETAEFFRDLFARSGLAAEHYRGRALARRVPACLRFLGVRTIGEARAKIAARPERAAGALNVVLLGVTEFFRDPAVFAKLRDAVLPELCRARARIRVWSAACSSGHELYSVAMLLGEAGALRECELLGTDCRPDAIAEAARGEFTAETLAALGAEGRELWFEGGRTARLHPMIRSAVRWKIANLFAGAERGPWDLILWRNMAIYLEAPAAEELWGKLVAELAPGGCLVVGKADHPPKDLPLDRLATCLYQKVEKPS